MKIGIYIGSFNPIHKAHIKIIQEAKKTVGLSKIIIVPVNDYYGKNNLIEFKHRIKMIELAIEGIQNIEICSWEKQNKIIYTYETIIYLKSIYPNDELYLIMGSDNYFDLNKWKNYNYIINECNLIVVQRNGDKLLKIFDTTNEHIFINADYNLSSTMIREYIKINEINKVYKFLNKKIVEYIIQNKLYF